jgi:ABC-type amino acid transport substrate-binding protein
MKFGIFTLFIIFLISCQSSHNQSASETNDQKPTLIMGTSADYPPFEFRKDGKVAGLDIDIAQEIAKQLGYTLKIQDTEFSSLIPSLQSGKVDFVMSGMSATEERKKNVLFSTTYYNNSFAFMTTKNSPIHGEADFTGKKIGVQLGSTMEKVAKEKAKSDSFNTKFKLISLGKNAILMEELKAGRLDGVIIEETQAKAFGKIHSTLTFNKLPEWNPNLSEGYAIAFNKNSLEASGLLEKFEKALKTLKTEEKLKKIEERWLEDL